MNRLGIDRRRFLKLVGGTALTYPFLRGLPSYADSTSSPQYLVLLFTPCGVVRHLWGAAGNKPTGALPVVTSPLAFRDTLAPLAPLSDQVVVLDGLSATAAQGSHEAGMAALWTGLTSSGSPATGPSIDQTIAAKLASGRPFDTVPLMVRSSADFTAREVKTRMIYTESGGFVDPYDDPAVARSTLFPSVAASTGPSVSAGPDKTTFIRQKVFAQLTTSSRGCSRASAPKTAFSCRASRPPGTSSINNSSPPPAQRPRAPRQGSRPPGTRRPRPISRRPPGSRWTSWRWPSPAISPASRASSSRPRRARSPTRGSTRPRPTRTTTIRTWARPRSTRWGRTSTPIPPPLLSRAAA